MVAATALRFVRLSENATNLSKPYPEAPGFDLCSAYDYSIPPRGHIIAQTDLEIQVPANTYGRLCPRTESGGTFSVDLDVGNGIIDGRTRGNLGVLLINKSNSRTAFVSRGQPLAQLICSQVASPKAVKVTSLANSSSAQVKKKAAAKAKGQPKKNATAKPKKKPAGEAKGKIVKAKTKAKAKGNATAAKMKAPLSRPTMNHGPTLYEDMPTFVPQSYTQHFDTVSASEESGESDHEDGQPTAPDRAEEAIEATDVFSEFEKEKNNDLSMLFPWNSSQEFN